MSGADRLIIEAKQKHYQEMIKKQSLCSFCLYSFNKEYHNKCPICGTKAKEK